MTQLYKAALVWFTRDLRLHDNPMLEKAHANAASVLHAVFIQDLLRPSSMPGIGKISTKRKDFLIQALLDLSVALKKYGHTLCIIDGSSTDNIPYLIAEYDIEAVYASQLSGFYEDKQWGQLVSAYPYLDVYHCSTATLYQQNDLPFALVGLPDNFTAFRKLIEKQPIAVRRALPTKTPVILTAKPITPSSNITLLSEATQTSAIFVGGETSALNHLKQYFTSQSASTYKQTRNDLQGFNASTKFSPWLAQGSLSAVHIYHYLKAYEARVGKNESTYWVFFELLWREFFFWTAKKQGHSLFTKRGRKKMGPLTSFYPERFRAWCSGETPWPIVNAGMKELVETGFLSNRARQIVASCFVNELELDWRYGAAFFEQHLLDYDVASNWGNWQYLAGVGADPRGKRHFDLAKQTKQFDPNEDYINRWDANKAVLSIDSRDAADWPIS